MEFTRILLLFFGVNGVVHAGYVPPGPKYACPTRSVLLYPCKCVKGSDAGLFVQCDNANLASLSLGLMNIAHDGSPIEELVFNKCHVARWYGPALYHLQVRVLKFIDTPLRFIEEHSFLGVNRTLQELHVIRGELEKFPREALMILGELVVLDINGHRINALPGDIFSGNLGVGRLERFHLTNGTLSSLPIEALAPLRKLKIIDLHGNQIKELKRSQFKGLREAERLDLSHNLISKLDASHLSDLTKMTFCNVSHNAIGELKRGTFARNSLLQVLNLSHNKLKKLDANAFRGMRFMRRLYLSDNQIDDVGRATFGSITRIGTIDLARNFIKKVDFQMFDQLKYAEILDVSENNVTIVEKAAFKDLFMTLVNLSRNEISVIEPGAFENCANITLDLSYNVLENISKKAFDSATYAVVLQLSYNLFTELDQVPLHNMTGLKVLNVSHNLLHTIPRQTFPKLYELHTIDLSYNNISVIYNAIFQTLFSLRYLNLSHNSLDKIKPSTFGPLPTLLELDLSYNQLDDIAKGSLARLASCSVLNVKHNYLTKIFQLPISLGYLDFSENSLEEIPTENTWPSMNALLSLDLSNNRLGDNLRHGSFSSLLTLRILHLKDNNITQPPWAALSTLSSLQYLYMQDNQLTTLEKAAFGRLPIVFELNLANNRIENVTTRAFEGLLQLLTLNFTNNNISYIPNGAFQGLVSLRTLDLSHNRIEKLDNKTHGVLDDCLSLQKIDLSHNRISFITRKMFPNDPWIPYRLKEVDLSYNLMPVLTFDLTVGTKKVEHLNVSHNNINDIRKYVIGNLTSLQVLDMSNNELDDISQSNVFQPPANLSEIYLQNNHLASVPLDKIVPMKQLRVLDVTDNDFGYFNATWMKIIDNGTDLRLSGNPIHCDCFARPLRRWMNTLTHIPDAWATLKCSNPSFLADKYLSEVTEDLMVCNEKDTHDDVKYDITPDVKYRDIGYNAKDHAWRVTWYVSSNKDIGDFYVVVREAGSASGDKSTPRRPIFEKEVIYSERSLIIDDFEKDTGKTLELCILARDSIGNVKHFRDSQCKILDKNAYGSANAMKYTLLATFIPAIVSYLIR